MTNEADTVKVELLPCPFCKSIDHLSMVAVGSYVGGMPARPYQVVCHHLDCEDVRGPVAYGKHEAIAAWNRRLPHEAEGKAGWENLSCDDQYDLARRIASNVGYVLVAEPDIDPWPKPAAPSASPSSLLDPGVVVSTAMGEKVAELIEAAQEFIDKYNEGNYYREINRFVIALASIKGGQ